MTKYIWIRKGLHLFAFIIPLSYYYFFSRYQFIVVVGILTGIAVIIEALRFKDTKIRYLFYKLIGKMLWNHEAKTITGATTFAIGAFVCAILFSKPVVVTGLLFLTFGDTIAYLVREKLKVKSNKLKVVEGGVAFLLISVTIVKIVPGIKLGAGLVGAFVACIVELLPWKIDDNLSIPLISCLIMQLLL